MLPASLAFAQSVKLNGKVTDERNLPLPGATVVLNNGAQATHTGKQGEFRFTFPDTGTIHLDVRYLGYQERKIDVPASGAADTLIIRLIPHVQQLSEVQIHDQHAELRKREETRSVEVVEQAYIRQHLSGSLMQTIDRLPGISTVEIGSGQSKPLIRGLGFNRVVVADHGVKHEAQQWGADHGLEIDQFSVERLKVIKGPASLKYGSDAIGGLIETDKLAIPEPETSGGSADLTGNSNNGSAGASLMLFSRQRKWYVKSRLSAVDYADYRVPVDNVTINGYRIPLVKNRLRNTAGSVFTGGVTLGRVDDRSFVSLFLSDYYAKAGFFANAHGIMPLNTDSSYDESIRNVQVPFQWVNHAKAILNAVLFHGKSKSELELGWQYNFRRELNTYYQHGYMPPVLPDTLGFSPDLAREFRKQTLSLNYRFSFPWGEKQTLTTGITTEYQYNRIAGWDFIIPSYDQVAGGIFLLDRVQLSGNLILEAGIRGDMGYVSILPWSDWFQTPVIVGKDTMGYDYTLRVQAMERLFGNLSWSAGLNYSTSSLTLRINAGKSFRMP
ncbi:MAG: TonB-dependent receptor, partial [Bacteroidales bacterium]|nr:TonB-dependent receptor [Bacteroidales bacterium]